jgi:hypothetical protein
MARREPISATRVLLPARVDEPFEVYRNGVRQTEDEDYEHRGGVLVFSTPLHKEGSLGFWRWLAGAFGVGTYRDNDVVDVRYELDGSARVAHDLPLDAPGEAAREEY